MRNSTDNEKENIGKIVKGIREKLNITQTELAEAVHLSIGTIKNIESGRAASIDNIINVLAFLGLSLSDIKTYRLPSEPELRQMIKDYHKKNKINDEQKLLDKHPTLLIAITDRLIPDGFLRKPKTIGELIDILKDEYGIMTSGSVFSNELRKVIDLGKISILDRTQKRFQYKEIK